MSELQDLYQEVILDHKKNPRNFRELEAPTSAADGVNPLCGDKVKIFLKLKDGVVEDVSFQGSGCAISTASVSLMTQAVKGKTADEAHELFQRFHSLVTSDEEPDLEALGKLAVFAGVREFPMRVKCATLAWHTLEAALSGADVPVSTE
jgi:nitrogen fixation NifU-like protein